MSEPAIKRIPSTVRSLLERGDRNGHTLTASEREQVAAMLLETGIAGAGNLTWMVNLIRYRLGAGSEFPVAPGSLMSQGYAYELAQRRAELIAKAIADARKVAA